MKNRQLYLSFTSIVLVVLFFGCSSSKSEIQANSEKYGGTSEVQVENPSITLADYLRRVSGVRVSGNGPSASILIRGTETAIGSSDPLFVLDGIKIGRDFSRVYSLVNMNKVNKIKVLKGIEASASYGMEGGNGVIEIFTEANS